MTAHKNGLDPFEQRIKDGLDQYEVPYNSADWSHLERRLNGTEAFHWRKGLGLAAGILIGGLLVGGTTWYLMSNGPEARTLADQGSVENVAIPTAEQPSQVGTVDAQEVPAPSIGQQGTTFQEAAQASSRENSPAKGAERTSAPKERPETAVSTIAHTAQPNTSVTPAAGSTPVSKPALGSNNLFTAAATEACSGNPITFKAEDLPENGIYLWNFGDGGFSNERAPQHVFSKPGSYQVTLSMSSPGRGTIHNKPSSAIITVHEVPTASFNVMKQEYEGHLPSVHFENRTMGATNYHWDFGDGASSTIAHPDHIYKKKGTYKVELTVTNELGCEDKTIREVRIENDYNLNASSAFTPNATTNSTFMPEALRDLGVRFTLSIYDPEGSLIYQTNDATKPWTGRPNNRGEFCAAGDYVWVAEIKENMHISETFTGKVRLER